MQGSQSGNKFADVWPGSGVLGVQHCTNILLLVHTFMYRSADSVLWQPCLPPRERGGEREREGHPVVPPSSTSSSSSTLINASLAKVLISCVPPPTTNAIISSKEGGGGGAEIQFTYITLLSLSARWGRRRGGLEIIRTRKEEEGGLSNALI